jgi:hypothetical protein
MNLTKRVVCFVGRFVVAYFALAILNQEDPNEKEQAQKTCGRWKCGCIIGAPAITGGTLVAISGGMIFSSLPFGKILCFLPS